MSKYMIIETKSPTEGGSYAFELGKQLRGQQHEVTVYLLQDAVFTARARLRAGESLLQDAQKAGLGVLADGISLRQRGIIDNRVAKSVRVSDMDELVDLLMERTDKAIWH